MTKKNFLMGSLLAGGLLAVATAVGCGGNANTDCTKALTQPDCVTVAKAATAANKAKGCAWIKENTVVASDTPAVPASWTVPTVTAAQVGKGICVATTAAATPPAPTAAKSTCGKAAAGTTNCAALAIAAGEDGVPAGATKVKCVAKGTAAETGDMKVDLTGCDATYTPAPATATAKATCSAAANEADCTATGNAQTTGPKAPCAFFAMGTVAGTDGKVVAVAGSTPAITGYTAPAKTTDVAVDTCEDAKAPASVRYVTSCSDIVAGLKFTGASSPAVETTVATDLANACTDVSPAIDQASGAVNCAVNDWTGKCDVKDSKALLVRVDADADFTKTCAGISDAKKGSCAAAAAPSGTDEEKAVVVAAGTPATALAICVKRAATDTNPGCVVAETGLAACAAKTAAELVTAVNAVCTTVANGECAEAKKTTVDAGGEKQICKKVAATGCTSAATDATNPGVDLTAVAEEACKAATVAAAAKGGANFVANLTTKKIVNDLFSPSKCAAVKVVGIDNLAAGSKLDIAGLCVAK
jgi:hypothetical protein